MNLKPVLLSIILLAPAPSLALAQSTTSPWTAPAEQVAAQPEPPPPAPNPFADLYPERAQRMGVEGVVAIRCVVMTTGMLSSCVIVHESPVGFGFGDATIRASHRWRMKPAIRDGVPVEGAVTIPIRWRLGHDKPTAAPPAPQP
jgi:protein TonB